MSFSPVFLSVITPVANEIVSRFTNNHCANRSDLKWLERALRVSNSLRPWIDKFGSRHLKSASQWKPGLSIVVIQGKWPSNIVKNCVEELLCIVRTLSEPFEILVVGGHDHPELIQRQEENGLTIHWLAEKPGSDFASSVRTSLRAARFDWVYFLDPGMRIDQRTIPELLQWRAPFVFALASQITGGEATGWNDFRIAGDAIFPFSARPAGSDLTRGHLFADSRAALFRVHVLRAVLAKRDPYFSPRWNDIEWGVRAWRAGYEVLFCPNSTVRQRSDGIAPPESGGR